MPDTAECQQTPLPDRRAQVLTETDRHAIAAIVVELMQAHGCRFADVPPEELRQAVKTVMVTRRAAFWAGMVFAGAVMTAFASGVCWILWHGFKAATQAK